MAYSDRGNPSEAGRGFQQALKDLASFGPAYTSKTFGYEAPFLAKLAELVDSSEVVVQDVDSGVPVL
ncbi:hypothetical protein VM1G_11548 [Cytospora mali]|uniref:Uncharacterized protein n=1 Tax=Cytospora mali TaxID=578113 RepID=A0A194VYQ7_CYTMA|nr:hypothetical protein VM1G_11548 [Valsa mali]